VEEFERRYGRAEEEEARRQEVEENTSRSTGRSWKKIGGDGKEIHLQK